MAGFGDTTKISDAVNVGIVNKKDNAEKGRIADLQVCDRPLSPAEIKELADENRGETCENKQQ